MAGKLTGKTAVVTGGATGIGWAIAEAFAREGCRVAIAGRSEDKLRQAVAQFTGQPSILFHPVDVGELASVERLFAWANQQLGHIDILVNSAGINVIKRTMAETSPEDWDSLLRINATGAFYCMRTVLPQMRQRRDGLIVNISSTSGKRASLLGGVGYSAAKFAITALGITAALEESRYGIRISNIYPGEVDTPILEQRPTPVSDEHRARMLQGEDVAAAALMIACLPPRAHVGELIIKPTTQDYA
ncbi:MAG TPA: SDR family oxidoreductase [Pirellulales bacterium]|jgi:NAD(P)-dependent dehydrogenase (short-subunit alcohol dehydrogenase family)|nr:SDR family oxidoreductase [Pirellulales bacterium]